MSGYQTTGRPGDDELLFLPLGGSGEIGMNLNLYGHAGKWLMIDCGITFGDDTTPGIDVMMPDPAFIEERKDELAGLVLTHAHEDHLGAVPYLWSRLECPIYATPFTAALLRRKLAESNLLKSVPIHEIPMSGSFTVGPFELEMVTLTHSIPEPNAVAVRTKAGTVMHTGDWKLDPDPLVGPSTDEKRLMEIGEEGVLAMVCDSTNALVPGRSGSESDVRDNMIELVKSLKGGVAIACFASNVARMETAAKAAIAAGRKPALAGRSLYRMNDAARETGYLTDLPAFLTDEEASKMPKDKVLLICTGSQGEPRAALSRIARDDHPNVDLGEGDTVIFSSREIPGNEMAIGRLQNDLAEKHVAIITARDAEIHTSGHPNRDELADMYRWIKPRIAIPVHGESRHMMAHARLAQECQVPHGICGRNGTMVKLTEAGPEVVDEVFSGRLMLDGDRLLPMGHASLKERRKLAYGGTAVVTVALDDKGRLVDDAQITVSGLLNGEGEDMDDLLDTAEEAVERMGKGALRDDGQVREAVRRAVRKRIKAMIGKYPPVDVHVIRV
jgi:ribonuclease J